MKLSVIIAVRNDLANLRQTVHSLRMTARWQPEIVLVDDDSDKDNYVADADFPDCKVIHNEDRMGVGFSREIGSRLATGRALLFTDAHMVFHDAWDYQAIEGIKALGEKGLLCSKYVSDKPFDKDWFDGQAVHGADLCHYRVKDGKFQIASTRPLPKNGNVEPLSCVPCVIGACYVIHKNHYREIGGFQGLDGYGGDEQLLSWKTWMAGGQVAVHHQWEVMHLNQEQRHAKWTTDDAIRNLVNCLYVERVVMGENSFEPGWSEFAGSLPYKLLPIVMEASARYRHPLELKVHPNAISERFDLQTIEQAINLAGKVA